MAVVTLTVREAIKRAGAAYERGQLALRLCHHCFFASNDRCATDVLSDHRAPNPQ